jgi:hypothetical protein
MPGDRYQFIFNGNYVNRGDQQIEVLLIILYAFIRRPLRVFIHRGNHDSSDMTVTSHFAPTFLSDIRMRYSKYTTTIYNAAINLFKHLPLATIISNESKLLKCFVVHGGISDKMTISNISTIDRYNSKYPINEIDRLNNDNKVFTDLLCSSPIKSKNEDEKDDDDDGDAVNNCIEASIGCLFSSKVTAKFCKLNGFN